MNKKSIFVLVVLALSISTSSLTFASDISSLIKDLGKKDDAKDASYELAKIGKPAVPELIKALESHNKYQKRYAARAIREMGQAGSDAIPALEKLLKDWDTQTREYAVEALGNMVQQVDQVIPILEKAKKDSDSKVRKKVCESLERIILAKKARETTKTAKEILPNTMEESIEGLGKKSVNSPSILSTQTDTPVNNSVSDIKAPMPDCNGVTVFGIPLKKSLQEVVTSIENNGISITEGCLSRPDDWFQEVSMEIKEAYQKSHVTAERTQAALQLIDQEKIPSFSFRYKDVVHIAWPYSLFRLLNTTSRDESCPVFEELPDIYNSQFYFACKGLPDYISYQSFQKITICFAAIEHNEPLSFLIELAGKDLDKDLAKRLVDKYGNPVLHWGADQRSKGCLEHFKKYWGFSYSLATPDEYIVTELGKWLFGMWGDILTLSDLIARAPNPCYKNFAFEWCCAETRIILLGFFIKTFEGEIEVSLSHLTYLYEPICRQLNSDYKTVLNSSKMRWQEILEMGKKGL